MEHTDQTLGADLRAPVRQPSGIRWVLRAVLVICGLLIGAVILSQPQVAGRIQAGADRVSGVLAGSSDEPVGYGEAAQLSAPTAEAVAQADSEPPRRAAASDDKPVAAVMPRNRVTVRRAGIVAGN